MASQVKHAFKVGDEVIYVLDQSGVARVKSSTVTRVTPKRGDVTLEDGTRWTPKWAGCDELNGIGTFCQAFLNTPSQSQELQETADRLNAAREEKKAKQEAEREANRKRYDEEMEEVRQVFDASRLLRDDMSDGSRIYTGRVPVKDRHAERKGRYEWVVIKCKDVEAYSWDRREIADQDIVVEAASTYTNGSSSSFSSRSSSRYANDTDAIYGEVHGIYHSW